MRYLAISDMSWFEDPAFVGHSAYREASHFSQTPSLLLAIFYITLDSACGFKKIYSNYFCV